MIIKLKLLYKQAVRGARLLLLDKRPADIDETTWAMRQSILESLEEGSCRDDLYLIYACALKAIAFDKSKCKIRAARRGTDKAYCKCKRELWKLEMLEEEYLERAMFEVGQYD